MSQSNPPPQEPPVIITGSSGLIGAAVVRALAPHYQVIGFDRAGAPYPPPQAECVSVDVAKAESIRRGLERVRYAYGERTLPLPPQSTHTSAVSAGRGDLSLAGHTGADHGAPAPRGAVHHQGGRRDVQHPVTLRALYHRKTSWKEADHDPTAICTA